MKKFNKKFWRGLLSILLAVTLLLNPAGLFLLSSLAYAQEASPSATQDTSQTEPTPTPTDQPSPTPEVSPTPELSPSPEPSLTPIESGPTVEPTPEPSLSPEPSPSTSPDLSASDTSTQSATTVESSPTSTSSPSPSPTPEPLWIQTDGGYTTQTLQLGVTYYFPPNNKVSLTFTQLPPESGTVTVRENEVPPTVDNPGSKDYEITSNMPNGSFSFDLTLPTNDPNKEVLSSADGQNYDPVSNETITSSDTVTIKGITHLTHFIVGDDTDDPNHPIINEFIPNPMQVSDTDGEWIELKNITEEEIDLLGWRINDVEASAMHEITQNVVIAPGGFAVLCRNSDATINGGVKCDYEWSSIILNNTGPQTIELVNPSGDVVDRISYATSDVEAGKSIKVSEDATRALSKETTFTYGLGDFGTPAKNTVSIGNHSFPSIQDAINAAEPSDTINVASGNYPEKLSIDRSLTLAGAGVENSIITESDDYCDNTPTLNIEANDVTVKNFTVNNAGCSESVIGVGYDTGNGYTGVTIQDNKLINGYYGIELSGGSSDIQILNNQIFGNDGNGIYSGGGGLSGLTINANEIGSQDQPNGDSNIYLDQLTGTVIISANTLSHSPYNGVYLGTISGATVTIGGENEGNGNTITNNSYEGLYIWSVESDSTVTIKNNTIEGNNTLPDNSNTGGIYLGSIGQSISTVTIQDNSISNNTGIGLYVNLIQDSTVNVAGNTVNNNTTQGIYLEQASGSEITIGENNTVSDNDDAGIYLGSVTGVNITGNTIQNNGLGSERTGIVVNSATGNKAHNNIISGNNVGVNNQDEDGDDFDARENFWGDVGIGPFHNILNPDGLDNNSVSDNVLFRPFWLDELLTTLSTNEVDPEDLASLLNTGSFSIPEGEDSSEASEVNVNEEVVINVSEDGGTSSVTLSAGTEITRTDEGGIDVGALTADDVTESSLAGLGSGVVIDGALQWGLDDIELTFDPAITLSIFVGTSFNGQTLDVVRSTTGDGGWTSDGIVAPATCLVASGICTFQATKASFYAATHTSPTTTTTSTSGGGGGTGGVGDGKSTQPPVCNDAKPGSAPTLLSATASINSVILAWSEASDPVTYYLVTYGESSGAQTYGNPNIGGKGTTTYTVSGLSGGQTYYFRVRAGNGCAPGDYSNELSATPFGVSLGGPAAGFIEGVLGAVTTAEGEQVEAGEIKGETQEISPASEESRSKPPLAGLLTALGSFLAAISSFFGRLFGR